MTTSTRLLNYASAFVPMFLAFALVNAWESEQLRFLLGTALLVSTFASAALITKTVRSIFQKPSESNTVAAAPAENDGGSESSK